MIFAEPPSTRYDLVFRVGPFPVRVHPLFWVSTLLLSMRGRPSLGEVAVWTGVVFVSILVHELGHSIAFLRFGCDSHIVLHGFGGLACPDGRSPRAWWRRAIVSFAGPLAGFALAGTVVAMLLFAGLRVPLFWWTFGSGAPIASPWLGLLIVDLLFVNVAWGMVNLLPIHPLDGGGVALAIAERVDSVRGAAGSLWLSFGVAMLAAIAGTAWSGDVFYLLFFGYLAYMSWRALRERRETSFRSLSLVGRVRSRLKQRALDRRMANHLRIVARSERVTPPKDVSKIADELLAAATERARRERALKK